MQHKTDDIFRDLVESTDDLVVRLDHQGRVFYISPSTMLIYGVPPQACLGKKALWFVHPGDRRRTQEMMTGFIAASVSSATLENRYVDAKGNIRHMMWSLNFRYGDSGALENINAIGRNITQHMLMEQRLRDNQERWNRLFMASPTWIVLASLDDGYLVDCNDTFCQDTGFTKKEVIGRSTMELGLWSGAKERNHILGLIDTRERIDKHPLKMRMRDGVLRDFLWSAIIVDVQGRECLLSVLVDVTDLKETQKQLAEANLELKARSHELAEMNSALKVLLRQREEDKTELESRVWHNLKTMILPHVFNLRQSGLNPTQEAHLDVIAGRLAEITSRLGKSLGQQAYDLTPRELEVAGHVLEGKTNKEIARLLNLSLYSIHSHRQAIRRKLGLLGTRVNLRGHLAGLSK